MAFWTASLGSCGTLLKPAFLQNITNDLTLSLFRKGDSLMLIIDH